SGSSRNIRDGIACCGSAYGVQEMRIAGQDGLTTLYSRLSRQSQIPRAPKTMNARMLIQSRMLTPLPSPLPARGREATALEQSAKRGSPLQATLAFSSQLSFHEWGGIGRCPTHNEVPLSTERKCPASPTSVTLATVTELLSLGLIPHAHRDREREGRACA